MTTEEILTALQPTNWKAIAPHDRYPYLAAVGANPTPELEQARFEALKESIEEARSRSKAATFGGARDAA